jgi:hypothetical protein
VINFDRSNSLNTMYQVKIEHDSTSCIEFLFKLFITKNYAFSIEYFFPLNYYFFTITFLSFIIYLNVLLP